MALIYNASFDSQTRVLSILDKAGNVISSCEVPRKSNELTLTATADNSSVKLRERESGTLSNTYEVNTGGGWQSYTFGKVIPLNAGESCKWRCKSHPTTQSLSNYVQFVLTGTIEASGNVNSMLSSDFGNITSLAGYDYAFYNLFNGCAALTKAPQLPATILATSCYHNMFAYCSSLAIAPELPATMLASDCYNSLFFGCSSLAIAPELPATNLSSAPRCYSFMFAECTALTRTPELPATILSVACYIFMFRACTSLIRAHELPASTLAKSCYSNMFKDCSALTQAPELPATIMVDNCYNGMFRGCTSLTQATELPAKILAKQCYDGMFSSCSNLKEVRVFATTNAESALNNWLSDVSATGDFYCDPNATIFPTDSASGIPSGWNRRSIDLLNALTLTATADNSSVKLTTNGTLDNTFEVDTGNGWEGYTFGTVIPLNAGQSCRWRCSAHPTTQSDTNYVQFVMTGTIEASGNVNSMLSRDFENLTSLSGYDYAFKRLFYGCTSLVQAPELPATTLANNCYYYMFDSCTSLVQSPELPATTLANNCYGYMFRNCTFLTQAPSLPATTLASRSYSFMFMGCTSLTKAPSLPATTLAILCYEYMFSGCESLKEVCISATTTETGALDYWLSGVSATGDFYCDPNATIFPTDSSSGIPQNWTRKPLADYPSTP